MGERGRKRKIEPRRKAKNKEEWKKGRAGVEERGQRYKVNVKSHKHDHKTEKGGGGGIGGKVGDK